METTLARDTGEDESVEAMLRESAAAFTLKETDHKALRKRRRTMPGYDEGLRAQMVALGWSGLLVAEALGGSGLGMREMGALLEELGKGLLAEPLGAIAVLAVRALQSADRSEAAAALLGEIAAGRRTLALAWQESPASIDPSVISAHAVECGGGWRINGSKRFVLGGGGADGFLVTARCSGGLALFHIDAESKGMSITHAWQIDGTPLCELAIGDVQVDAGALIASPGHGLAAVTRALDDGAVAASAELLGVSRAVFAMTLEYMRTRVQFDKPIGSFQALQHKLVDLLIQLELSAAVVDEAAAVMDSDADASERGQMASRAKARCSDAGLRITREAIQLHGAIAYTDECDVGLYLKRALVLSAWLGNGAQHRQRYVALADAGLDGAAAP